MLIDKFFNQTFSKSINLNTKQDSYQEEQGDLIWNVTDIVKHKLAKNLNQIRFDKHGFKKESGNGDKIPLSFYFDLSGSMNEYIGILSVMALRILKKGVRIIVGFNQNAYLQINKINSNCSIEQFKFIMSNLQEIVNHKATMEYYKGKERECEKEQRERKIDIHKSILSKIKNLEFEILEGVEIDRYLIDKQAEKTVVFSDFDPKIEVENLSTKCEVYWFCFREWWRPNDLQNFRGKFFKTLSEKDIMSHLLNIDRKIYEKKQRESNEYETLYSNSYGLGDEYEI